MSEDRAIAEAKSAAYRASLAISQGRRGMADLAGQSAQLTVIRKLLSASLQGGEVEFWRLVEKELRE